MNNKDSSSPVDIKSSLSDREMKELSPQSPDSPKSQNVIANPTNPTVRDEWGSDIEYMLVYVGFAIGYGALWGLPFLLYDNGGIVFLIPYTVCIFIFVAPQFALETAVGQYHRSSLQNQYRSVSKKWKGVPQLHFFAIMCVSLNYIIIMTWGVVYLFKSFMNPLPWMDDAEAR